MASFVMPFAIWLLLDFFGRWNDMSLGQPNHFIDQQKIKNLDGFINIDRITSFRPEHVLLWVKCQLKNLLSSHLPHQSFASIWPSSYHFSHILFNNFFLNRMIFSFIVGILIIRTLWRILPLVPFYKISSYMVLRDTNSKRSLNSIPSNFFLSL